MHLTDNIPRRRSIPVTSEAFIIHAIAVYFPLGHSRNIKMYTFTLLYLNIMRPNIRKKNTTKWDNNVQTLSLLMKVY